MIRVSSTFALSVSFFAAAVVSLASPQARSTSVTETGKALIERTLGAAAESLVVEQIPRDDGRDVFEIESRNGKIVLRGNSAVSLASALDRYLQDYAHADVSWNCGNQLALPTPLPGVPQPVHVVSPYPFRFAYNYCTHGYTLAWRHWPQWERELDYLAMQGVNLALIIEGYEQVWIDALGAFGYSDEEVRRWLVMPTHQPWQYMSNMQGYGGPVPASLVRRRLELARKIVQRMRELGMAPVLPGYYGIVPPDFGKRFPQADVRPQGRWAGGLSRPAMLAPTDPLFAKVAAAFYSAQKKAFGAARFFSADPFHEGGSTKGIDLAAAGRGIFSAMQKASPGSTWVLMSWQANPRSTMIEALPKDRLLVLDLFCDVYENWRRRNQFGQTPWLWCAIQNFGGNSGLDAAFRRIAEEPPRALAEAGPRKGWMRGIGAVMEGSETNPMVWEMFFGNAWRTHAPEIDAWVRAYARRRYGADDPSAVEALRILLDTAYSVRGGHGQFPHNSAVCARPSLKPEQRARAYTTTTPEYEPWEFARAWEELLEAAPACSGSDGYRYDVVDFGRQTLADLGTRYHRAICMAWSDHNRGALDRFTTKTLRLIEAMDELVGTRKEFLLGRWLEDAKSWGSTPAESALCEWNARALLTTWTDPPSILDYANREWAGLLKGFYLMRWRTWIQALRRGADAGWKIDTRAARKRIEQRELEWVRAHDSYATQPKGDEIETARRLWAEFREDALAPTLLAGLMLTNVVPQDFVGRWRYTVAGVTYEREILPDGALRLYRNGQLYTGWSGYTWRFRKPVIELRDARGRVFARHALQDRDTLLFRGERWGPAKRVKPK